MSENQEQEIQKKRIAVIGANSFQNPLIQKARELGYETHVFAWQDGSVGERTADFFYPISIVERDQILEKCQELQPAAIASIGSDLAMLTVNYVADRLGLPGNSLACTRMSTNKYHMRCAFQRAGVPVPGFVRVEPETAMEEVKKQGLCLPVIVKPTDRSGSRGITRLESLEGLVEAVRFAAENSFEGRAIVEECIPGEEYSCECISSRGIHHCLTMTRKYTTGAPHFIETGHLQPCGLSPGQMERVKQAVFAGLTALEVTTGASHAEFMVDEAGEVRIIEIGARMGGDCIGSDLVPLSTGYDYVRMVLDTAQGREPDFTPIRESGKAAYIHFIFGEEDLKLLERFRLQAPEKLRFVSPIEPLDRGPVVDSSTRYGYFIATFDHVEEKEAFVGR